MYVLYENRFARDLDRKPDDAEQVFPQKYHTPWLQEVALSIITTAVLVADDGSNIAIFNI